MLFPFVFFLFIGMPILEIYLLITVGSSIGAPLTIAIVILTAILGTWMLRAQGVSTLNKARSKMSGGQIPAFEMMEGLALGVGGALLLTPGFLTDSIGFICLIPFTRRLLIGALSKRVTVGAVTGGFSSAGAAQGRPGSRPGKTGGQSIEGEIIEGEYTRKDD